MNPELKKAILAAKKALKAQKKAANAARIKSAINGGRTPGHKAKNKMTPELTKNLSKWGVKSLNDLMKVNTANKKYAYLGQDEIQRVKDLKEAVDIAVVTAQVLKFRETEGKSSDVTAAEVKALGFFAEDLDFHLKTFGIEGGDEGFEWIPTAVSDSYIDEFNLERKVSGLFQEIRMPTNPYRFPVLTGGAIARKVGAVTALAPAQVFKTDKTITFDAIKMTNQYELPEELNEDSAPDVVKVIRQELIEGQEKAMEIAILEGDTAGTMHYFSQLPDVTVGTLISAIPDSAELFFDGLRLRALASGALGAVDAGAVQVSETELSKARSALGKFGVDPTQLAIICESKGYNQLLQLDDVRTLEQYGAKAPVITGELAKYEGAPVIVSEYLRDDTSVTGKNTLAGPNDKLSILMVNRKRWFVGLRRAIQVRVEKNRTQYDVLDMVSFARKAFQGVLKPDASNYAQESSVSLIYNIAK